jgi:integrase
LGGLEPSVAQPPLPSQEAPVDAWSAAPVPASKPASAIERKEIGRLTQKRRKKVILPLNKELLFALEAEQELRNPNPTDRVLTNPATGRPLTRPRLYQRMVALGKRAGVPDAHPHRFRDTLAVDMLEKGASPYDVAKTLGDTIETIEKHYAPFTKELRDRVRRIMEKGEGLEKTVGTFWSQSGETKENLN